MRFIAYDLSIDLIRQRRDPLAVVRHHDVALAKHGRDALNSCFTIALGSLREVSAVLEIAAAHAWLSELPFAAQRHRLGGMIYALARR